MRNIKKTTPEDYAHLKTFRITPLSLPSLTFANSWKDLNISTLANAWKKLLMDADSEYDFDGFEASNFYCVLH